ncbi:m-AAA protease-interacting protein 1, mitochondrial [Culex quinquefasciatus]|uniref:m-AAA protease-interacting protein 1, mitochondrial n=1 Tax=Culex quinquefasciatus TaxID=7176 RepID=UPI0018E2C07B|nr:m-AAA protease-interacting protein 1, mitochondrial [Culex quinquefasciatus]
MFLRQRTSVQHLINISRYVSSPSSTNSGAAAIRQSNSSVQLQRLLPAGSQTSFLARRTYSTGSQDQDAAPRKPRSLPRLMDFPELVWPSVIKTVKNWIMVHFIIRPYFDREFTLPDFVQGAKQALQVVSASLAGGELKNLDGLVERQTLNDLKTAVGKMSVAQRYDLMVAKEDIYFSFPYQVGVMFDEEDEESQKRFVEITMVFHVLKGLKGMIERGDQIPLNIGVMPEFRDKICICNYRFIKEFTKGVDSDWTVNIVNHFKASDLAEEANQ